MKNFDDMIGRLIMT